MYTISVIVPVYNVEDYLEECVFSILNQTYRDLDIILVNDGSTDSSGILCDHLKEKDDRITVVHQPNQGLIKARYNGVKYAKGTYITFVDSDDWIDSNMYADMIDIVEKTSATVVISGIYRYFADDDVLMQKSLLAEGYYEKEQIEEKIIPNMLWSAKWNDWELDPSLCTKLCKKDVILPYMERVKDMDAYFGEDSIVIFPMLLNLRSMYISHQAYYYHRQRGRNVTPGYVKASNFFDKTYKVYQYLKSQFEDSSYKDVLIKQLDNFYMNAVQLKRACYKEIEETQAELFPYKEISKDAKIVIYGAGQVGCEYMAQNQMYQFCNVVLWVDKQYQTPQNREKGVSSPEMLTITEFDYVIIAVKFAGMAKEIKEELIEKGIEASKIVWNGNRVQRLE